MSRRPRPKGTTNSRRGAGLEWLCALMQEEPDGQCRDWPYEKLKGGYGQVIFNGRTTSAHRAALIMATRENFPGLLALHSCDHPICCAPWHLRWGTNRENAADAFRRGRRNNAFNFWRRQCADCGLVTNPGALARHQKRSEHKEVMPDVP